MPTLPQRPVVADYRHVKHIICLSDLFNRAAYNHLALASAAPPLPLILSFRISPCLPLHVRRCIGPSAGKRDDVILNVARTSAARATSRWAGMRQLELTLGRG